jgi:hypothetical protein
MQLRIAAHHAPTCAPHAALAADCPPSSPLPPPPPPADKKSLNVGKSGLSAGLDDYVYDGLGQDDEFDFM